MKNTLIVLIIFLLALSACEKIDNYTQFDLPYNTAVTIPATFGINLPFNIFTPDIETNSESVFEINDTRTDLIEEVKLTQISLNVINPVDGNFSFLKSITVYMSADGLSEIEIASKGSIPDNIGNLLVLDPIDIDFKEYIKKDKINLRVNTVTDQMLFNDYTIGVDCIFHVDAKILGI